MRTQALSNMFNLFTTISQFTIFFQMHLVFKHHDFYFYRSFTGGWKLITRTTFTLVTKEGKIVMETISVLKSVNRSNR